MTEGIGQEQDMRMTIFHYWGPSRADDHSSAKQGEGGRGCLNQTFSEALTDGCMQSNRAPLDTAHEYNRTDDITTQR